LTAYRSSIFIQAPASRVWAVLTNAAAWSSWNTTVDRVDGEIALGNKLTVHARLGEGESGGRAFPVRVAELVPPRRMVWVGGLPLGLFRGERRFTIEDRGEGRVEFAMHEIFSGLLAGMITRSMPDLQPSFDEFCQALKRRVEGG
jgi:hypothetical protein